MTREWISLTVFVLCYVLFVILPGRRSCGVCRRGGGPVPRDSALGQFAQSLAGARLGHDVLSAGRVCVCGAPAHVVTLGVLKKHGYSVGFGDFMRIGIPFTLATVFAACALVW